MENPIAREILGEQEQRAVLRKITLRLVPLLFICYIVAYIDRINVGFAKDHLREPLGIDPAVLGTVFGTGAGLFFIGYFLFEVPSNLALQRFGARVWIARIMIVWGLVSMCFIFVKGTTSFYLLRFLLGAAEAGFFPGIILYLTYWFPAKERAKTMALFALGGVAAGVVGSPISSALLEMDGIMNWPGWKWLFLIEAIPAVLLGLVVLLCLPNGPSEARWLPAREKQWLLQTLEDEAKVAAGGRKTRLRDAFTSPQVWQLTFIYFLINVAGYGFEFWLPSIVKKLSDRSDSLVGVINMIPYIAAGIAMVVVGRNSDRKGERTSYIGIAAFCSAIGFTAAAVLDNPFLAIAALTLAFAGQKSTLGPFWALGASALSGTAAAGGIALINSIGNLGGYVGPKIVGVITDKTGSSITAMFVLGGAMLVMGLFAFGLSLTGRFRRDLPVPLPTEER
ncbi:MFS transporter [Luteolibacter sp. GHJ8]|jgi:ACS family tartrate transporter-like MFS transporter|uniref:MFS transporter n=1 Tax=Luteolibacter rhizosphaerae TaxID=2989719 RepID=A0ABT3G289_9BACT|nr:MFS transporter [Luteolibacter rhizosphaerae]MCW1913689.1 MFS transporter [Luteolibacter rhizosphaerae]